MGIIQKSVAEELERQAATAVKKVQDFNAEQNAQQNETTEESTEEEKSEEAPEGEPPVDTTEENGETQVPAPAEERKIGRPRKSRK